MSQPNTVDPTLVLLIHALIPPTAWSFVRSSVIEYFVDNMTSEVLLKLTGDTEGFEKAEAILHNHYEDESANDELITDLLKIAGSENALIFLNSLNLQDFKEDVA